MEDHIHISVLHGVKAHPFSSLMHTDSLKFSCAKDVALKTFLEHGCEHMQIEERYTYWFYGDLYLQDIVLNQPCGCVTHKTDSSICCIRCEATVDRVDLVVPMSVLHNLKSDVLVMGENEDGSMHLTCYVHLFDEFREFTKQGLTIFQRAKQKSLRGVILNEARSISKLHSWCIDGKYSLALDPKLRLQILKFIVLDQIDQYEDIALQLEEALYLDADNKKQYMYTRNLLKRIEYLMEEEEIKTGEESKYKPLYKTCFYYESAQRKALKYFEIFMEHELSKFMQYQNAHENAKDEIPMANFDEDHFIEQSKKEMKEDPMHDILQECIKKLEADTTTDNHEALDKCNRISAISNSLYEMMEWGGLELNEAVRQISLQDKNLWWNSGSICKMDDPNRIDCYFGYSSVSIWNYMESSFGYNCFGVMSNRTRLYTFDQIHQCDNVEIVCKDGKHICGYVLKSCPHCSNCTHNDLNTFTVIEGKWEMIPEICKQHNETLGIRMPMSNRKVHAFSRDKFNTIVSQVFRLDNYYVGNFTLTISKLVVGRRLYPKLLRRGDILLNEHKEVLVGRVEPGNIGVSCTGIKGDTIITAGMFLDGEHMTGYLVKDGKAMYCGTTIGLQKDGYGEMCDYFNWSKKTKSVHEGVDKVSISKKTLTELIRYVGAFSVNTFEGYGRLNRLTSSNMSMVDCGVFHDDRLSGNGMRILEEGVYSGEFYAGRLVTGAFLPSKCTRDKYHFTLYKGGFNGNSLANGKGTIFTDNFRYDGNFSDGIFTKGNKRVMGEKDMKLLTLSVHALGSHSGIDIEEVNESKTQQYCSMDGLFKHVAKGDLTLFTSRTKYSVSIPVYPMSTVTFLEGKAVDTKGNIYEGEFPRGTFVRGKIWFADGRYREGEFKNRKRFFGFEIDTNGDKHMIRRGKKIRRKTERILKTRTKNTVSEEYKEWLANKGENGNALQLDLAFSTLAFTKKERGGKEEKWWENKYVRQSAQSPCSIQDLWKPTSHNETDERVKNVWARLRIWGATDITSISSGKISRWACHPTRLCSLHKKPLCCKTEECRFGKSKKK